MGQRDWANGSHQELSRPTVRVQSSFTWTASIGSESSIVSTTESGVDTNQSRPRGCYRMHSGFITSS